MAKFLDHAVSEDSYLQSIECADPRKFDLATDAEVYEAADLVKAASTTTKKALEATEVSTGNNWNPTGIMFDPVCRAIVRPCTGWLRDWMHMLAVAGVANTEVMQMCKAQGKRSDVVYDNRILLLMAFAKKHWQSGP